MHHSGNLRGSNQVGISSSSPVKARRIKLKEASSSSLSKDSGSRETAQNSSEAARRLRNLMAGQRGIRHNQSTYREQHQLFGPVKKIRVSAVVTATALLGARNFQTLLTPAATIRSAETYPI